MLAKIYTANAKINLYLQVLNKREDNYHNISSLLYPVPICDELIFADIKLASKSSIKVVCEPDLEFLATDNLVFKAAKLLQIHTNKQFSGKITLKKNIPIGAGLGGGSSDAATTLLALNEILQLDIDMFSLQSLAGELGSDVPFFLYNSPAICKERGNIVQLVNFSLQNWHLLIIFPNIHINTQQAYKNLERGNIYTEPIIEPPKNINILRKNLTNDFEKSIFKDYPTLENIKRKLIPLADGLVLMSGSGSSIFALFQTAEESLAAAEEFKNSNYFLYRCKL